MESKAMIENIRFAYETLGSSSYLVATLEEGFVPIHYQMEMLSANEIANILPANKHQKNADVKIYYNATSKISLAQAVNRQKMSKEHFLNLISGAITAFKEVKEYQLVNTGIVLEPEFIFVNSGTFEPSFVYLPLYNDDAGVQRLREFTVSLILKDVITVSSDNFVQVLLSRLNADSLSLNELEKLVNELKKTSGPINANNSSASSAGNSASDQKQAPPVADPHRPAPPVAATPAKAMPANRFNIPGGMPGTKDAAQKKGKSVDPGSNQTPGFKKLIMIGLQVVFLIAIIALLSSDALTSAEGGIDSSKALGVLIAVAGIDFVVYRELFKNNGQDKKDVKQSVPPKKAVVPIPANKAGAIPASKPPIAAPAPQAVIQPVQPAPQPVSQPAPSVVGSNAPAGVDDTVVLISNNASSAYLEHIDNGISNKVPLDKASVIIGRLKGQVDYVVSNNKVGKIHAEFISREGSFFVKDYNSKNGTYINGSGQRITSNIEYQVNNNDRIVLADSEFILRC